MAELSTCLSVVVFELDHALSMRPLYCTGQQEFNVAKQMCSESNFKQQIKVHTALTVEESVVCQTDNHSVVFLARAEL